MNGPVSTRLGAERARNGHPAPYNVKYWDIGNEPYGAWQLGRTDLKYYVLKHNGFAAAMRKADPSIILLASGNMPEPMDLTGEMRAKDVDHMKAVEGTPEDWTGGESSTAGGIFPASRSTGTPASASGLTCRRRSSCRSTHRPEPATTKWNRRRSNSRAIRPTSCSCGRRSGTDTNSASRSLRRSTFSFPSTNTRTSAAASMGSGYEDGTRLWHDPQ